MKRFFFPIVFFAIVFLSFILLEFQKQSFPLIVAASSNPGKIFVYQWNGKLFERREIDTGFKLVHTVRIGDIYNDGRKVIIAGVGNSFYGPPFGCQVVAYNPLKNFEKIVIDDIGDLRCKDLTIGDANNDGKNEIVLGTHGEGLIKIYEWAENKWNKQEVDRNFIKQIDEKEETNHRIPLKKITYDTIVQTAVHIVKVGDVDNDGKNEIVATESSPLEYTEGPQLSFVNVYKFDGKNWARSTIHRGSGFQHRSVLIADVDNDDINDVLIGAAPSRLFKLRYDENWSSALIYNETDDKNMKGLYFEDVYSKGRKTIVLATGIPNTLIYTLDWNGRELQKNLIGNVSQVLEQYNVIKDLKYNALEVQVKDVDKDGYAEIVVGGEADTSVSLDKLKSQDNIFGWESTPYGFLVVYKFDGKLWNPMILDTYSVLGMDVG